MVIGKHLITYQVSSLNITTDFPLSPPRQSFLLPQERQRYTKLRDDSISCIVRVITFCILFNLYANSHNTTKLNYMATSITLPLVSHDARS